MFDETRDQDSWKREERRQEEEWYEYQREEEEWQYQKHLERINSLEDFLNEARSEDINFLDNEEEYIAIPEIMLEEAPIIVNRALSIPRNIPWADVTIDWLNYCHENRGRKHYNYSRWLTRNYNTPTKKQ